MYGEIDSANNKIFFIVFTKKVFNSFNFFFSLSLALEQLRLYQTEESSDLKVTEDFSRSRTNNRGINRNHFCYRCGNPGHICRFCPDRNRFDRWSHVTDVWGAQTVDWLT